MNYCILYKRSKNYALELELTDDLEKFNEFTIYYVWKNIDDTFSFEPYVNILHGIGFGDGIWEDEPEELSKRQYHVTCINMSPEKIINIVNDIIKEDY